MSSPRLPALSSYSAADKAAAVLRSPALAHYLDLVTRPAQSVRDDLRLQRHVAWCEATLATLTERASAQQVCLAWSFAADAVTQAAWRAAGCDEGQLSLFALGKWGSQELNLSSDIDVIFVSREAPTKEDLKRVRDFITLLTELTPFGFCFRVDTDLKPGGRLAPLVSSLKQFEDYYWSSGQTWERLALVRLRAIAGSEPLIKDVADVAEKFIFRRFTDFTLLEDLKHLRAQIHSHYPQLEADSRNLKLAPGGIRDIELFIHALQVIHGGKLKSLRTPSTALAASRLAAEGRFPQGDLDFLIASYWRFRTLENLVQAHEDQQTHQWTNHHGAAELQEFLTTAKKVESIVEGILGKAATQPLVPTDPVERDAWLTKLGFDEITVRERVPELLALTAMSTKTAQDEELRRRVLRRFLEELAALALDKNLGVALLIDFFRSTRAKTGFFSLLAIEDRLIHELAVLFGCSPYLGGVIAARPEVLDSFIFRAQASTAENLEQLLENLTDQRLLTEIVNANQFLQKHDLIALCTSLTDCADDICARLLENVRSSVGSLGLRILALGKWGGRELGFRSDLDFIFITQGAPQEADQKAARRFLSRLTEAHKGGAIYSVDMRLRPSGKGGLLLVSEDALVDYLVKQAAPWERQSYLRAREVTPGTAPAAANQAHRLRDACCARPLNADDLAGLREIREKLLVTPKAEELELKMCSGGLVDIEFAVQIAILNQGRPKASDPIGNSTREMILTLAAHDIEWHRHADSLLQGYDFLRLVEQLIQLVNLHSVTTFRVTDPAFERVAKIIKISPIKLAEQIREYLQRNSMSLKHLDLRQRAK